MIINQMFRKFQRVRTRIETKGDDHTGITHTLPAGVIGIVDTIEHLPQPQGLAFTVWLPINEATDQGIVNVFDESDGPITDFLEPAPSRE